MTYPILSLICILAFVWVHLFAEKARNLSFGIQSKFLSIGGGTAIAYVFIDLLPKLSKGSLIVQNTLNHFLPFAERHVFIMALFSFLLFFTVERLSSTTKNTPILFLSIGSYALFNFLVGYAISDPNDPEVQPLALFTFAISLHYFTNDYSLSKAHGAVYDKWGKGALILSLCLGWIVGFFFALPQASVALTSAFIGGGVIMNVTRHELPEDTPNSLNAFLLGAVLYTTLLLSIGN